MVSVHLKGLQIWGFTSHLHSSWGVREVGWFRAVKYPSDTGEFLQVSDPANVGLFPASGCDSVILGGYFPTLMIL